MYDKLSPHGVIICILVRNLACATWIHESVHLLGIYFVQGVLGRDIQQLVFYFTLPEYFSYREA